MQGPKSSCEVLAFFDEGSTISLIDRGLAKIIGVTGVKSSIVLSGVNDTDLNVKISSKVNCSISSSYFSKFHKLNGIFVVEGLSLPIQSLGLDILDYDHLRNLDIKTYSSESPKILLGQDNWELIVSREVRVGPLGSPAASLTLLGWVVHGSHASKQPEKHSLLHIGVLGDDKKSQDDFELHELVKNYFSLEGLGISKASRISRSEERANSILQNTTKFRGDHWETGLLWANEVTRMPNNSESAFARLKLIERRLDRD